MSKARKPDGTRGLDSESDEENQNAGECVYINSLKTGCPRRNTCGYIHRYGISTISAKARHWPTNAPFEKPQTDSEDVHKAKLAARRWGNEYVSGNVEQVSEIPPTKSEPKKITLEYVGGVLAKEIVSEPRHIRTVPIANTLPAADNDVIDLVLASGVRPLECITKHVPNSFSKGEWGSEGCPHSFEALLR